jgi:hypothetical protein
MRRLYPVLALGHAVPPAEFKKILTDLKKEMIRDRLNPAVLQMEELIKLHQGFSKYAQEVSPLIQRDDLDPMLAALFIIGKYKDHPDLLYFILLDKTVAIETLDDSELEKVSKEYLVLRFLCMLLGNQVEMGKRRQKLLEKVWAQSFEKAYFSLNANEDEKKFMNSFKEQMGMDYFGLYEKGKEFVDVRLKEILDNHGVKNSVDSIEFRIKNPKRSAEKAQQGRHLTDVVGVRIICRSMADAYLVKNTIDYETAPLRDREKDYHVKPKSNGYHNVLHSTYEKLFLKDLELKMEIQYVGSPETNVRNQRGEDTDYLTVYARKLLNTVKKDMDLVFLSRHEKLGAGDLNFKQGFFDIAPGDDIYSLIYQSNKNYDSRQLPKRLSAYLLVGDRPQSLSFEYVPKAGDHIYISNDKPAPNQLARELKVREGKYLHQVRKAAFNENIKNYFELEMDHFDGDLDLEKKSRNFDKKMISFTGSVNFYDLLFWMHQNVKINKESLKMITFRVNDESSMYRVENFSKEIPKNKTISIAKSNKEVPDFESEMGQREDQLILSAKSDPLFYVEHRSQLKFNGAHSPKLQNQVNLIFPSGTTFYDLFFWLKLQEVDHHKLKNSVIEVIENGKNTLERVFNFNNPIPDGAKINIQIGNREIPNFDFIMRELETKLMTQEKKSSIYVLGQTHQNVEQKKKKAIFNKKPPTKKKKK